MTKEVTGIRDPNGGFNVSKEEMKTLLLGIITAVVGLILACNVVSFGDIPISGFSLDWSIPIGAAILIIGLLIGKGSDKSKPSERPTQDKSLEALTPSSIESQILKAKKARQELESNKLTLLKLSEKINKEDFDKYAAQIRKDEQTVMQLEEDVRIQKRVEVIRVRGEEEFEQLKRDYDSQSVSPTLSFQLVLDRYRKDLSLYNA